MIRGEIEDTRYPYLECVVHMLRFGSLGRVRFRVDTGADLTCVHPKSAEALSISFAELSPSKVGHGVGGQARYSPEPALLIFSDDGRPVYRHIELWVAMPTQANQGLDSLLGVDIIGDWQMVYDAPNGRLEFAVPQVRPGLNGPGKWEE